MKRDDYTKEKINKTATELVEALDYQEISSEVGKIGDTVLETVISDCLADDVEQYNQVLERFKAVAKQANSQEDWDRIMTFEMLTGDFARRGMKDLMAGFTVPRIERALYEGRQRDP